MFSLVLWDVTNFAGNLFIVWGLGCVRSFRMFYRRVSRMEMIRRN